MNAVVEALCISSKKGIPKKAVDEVEFQVGWGIVNDAHGGSWHRQVSLLAGESIDTVKAHLPSLSQGAFAENIVTRGLDLSQIRPGQRLQIGAESILEITQIGKQCHNDGCAIKKATGDCIMPKEGVFAQVLQAGKARPGDSILLLDPKV
jgi:MOSC domain-containing protein YiiM